MHVDGHFTFVGPGLILFINYLMIFGGNIEYQQNKNEKIKNKIVVHTLTFKKVKGTPILELSIKSHN